MKKNMPIVAKDKKRVLFRFDNNYTHENFLEILISARINYSVNFDNYSVEVYTDHV